MVTICCVLKSGGAYFPEYVHRLHDGVSKHSQIPFDFVCFSDLPEVATHSIDSKYFGWWSKLQIFDLINTPVLYFDLDTVINGSIDELLEYPHRFTMLADMDGSGRNASGVMAFNGDYRYIAEGFCGEAALHYTRRDRWGDQAWISEKLRHKPEQFQQIWPDMFCSYKWDTIDRRRAAPVVVYHGTPRPHQTGWRA